MDAAALKSKRREEKFQFGPWTLAAVESHILISEGPDRERFEAELRLPQLPEMIFADNVLRLKHSGGFGIEFNALDALKLVDPEHDHLKVAVSEAWKEARGDCEHINDIIKPFDWTFTTPYSGTLLDDGENALRVEETDERIDMEKLKIREKIHFFGDIMLFEDELADNGRSVLSIKIRVMPTSFFVLMRFYMRVDNVLVRVYDTRVFHQSDKDYIIREITKREAPIKDLKVPLTVITDANIISQHLPLNYERVEKLYFPAGASPNATEFSTVSTLV